MSELAFGDNPTAAATKLAFGDNPIAQDTGLAFGDNPVADAPTNEDSGFLEGTKQFISDFPMAIVGGARDAAQETIEGVISLSNYLNEVTGTVRYTPFGEPAQEDELPLPEVKQPEGTPGKITRSMAQFFTGFIPVSKALKGAGLVRPLVRGAAAGAITDFTVFDPQEERLSNIIQEYPSLENPVAEFLMTQAGDSDAVGRLKQSIEGLVLGVATDGLVRSLVALRGIRKLKTIKKAEVATPEGKPKVTVHPGETIEFTSEGPKAVSSEKFAGNINLRKLDTPQGIRDVIFETAEREGGFVAARRGVQSNDETKLLAASMGMDEEQLLKRRRGQAFNAESALRARELLVDSGEELVALANKAVGGSDSDLAAFNEAYLRHVAVQEQVSGITAEAGRALQIFKVPVETAANREKAIRAIVEGSGGRPKLEELAKEISGLETTEQVAAYARKSHKATTSDKLIEVWINALLSGPQTHAVNMTSNTLVGLFSIPEHVAASALGAFRGGSDKVFAEEIPRRFMGFIQGAKDGVKLGGKALITGKTLDPLTKNEVARHRAIGGVAGEFIRVPGRVLVAEDEFFKAVARRMESSSLATRKAVGEGKTGEELAERIKFWEANPTHKMKAQIAHAGNYYTFTKPLGDFGQSLQQLANKHPTVKVVVPFIRTPANIVKFAGERSPLAPFFSEFRDAIKKGGASRDIALARAGVGSAFAATIAMYAADGKITGGGPKDPDARALLYQTGWQPYSVLIGDKYYSYGRIEPLGILMGVAADFAEISGQTDDKSAQELAGMVAMAFTKNITNKTFLRGISEVIHAADDPVRYGERWIQGFAGTVVPTGVAQYTRTDDPVLRQTLTVRDRIYSRLPGYSKDLPPRLNLWGESIILEGGLGFDIVSPIYTSKRVKEPIAEEMLRLKIAPAMPDRKIDGVELDGFDYNELVKLSGERAKISLTSLVTGLNWSQIPDPLKVSIIKNMITQHKAIGKKRFLAAHPEIFRQTIQKRVQPFQEIAK